MATVKRWWIQSEERGCMHIDHNMNECKKRGNCTAIFIEERLFVYVVFNIDNNKNWNHFSKSIICMWQKKKRLRMACNVYKRETSSPASAAAATPFSFTNIWLRKLLPREIIKKYTDLELREEIERKSKNTVNTIPHNLHIKLAQKFHFFYYCFCLMLLLLFLFYLSWYDFFYISLVQSVPFRFSFWCYENSWF